MVVWQGRGEVVKVRECLLHDRESWEGKSYLLKPTVCLIMWFGDFSDILVCRAVAAAV